MSSSVPLRNILIGDKSLSSNTSSTPTWTKWQMALIIGAPVVFGAGLYFYYRRNSLRRTKNTTKNDSAANKKESINKKTEADRNDPFAKAMSFKAKGNKLFKEGKYEEAIACYADAINECPNTKKTDLATFYQNRAASYEMLKKYKEVIIDCNKAIDLNPKYTKALARRAKAHEAMGHLNDALNDITAVCMLEQFQNSTNLLMTDRILKQQSKIKAKALYKIRSPKMPPKNFIRHYLMSFSKDPIFSDINVDVEHVLRSLEAKQEEKPDSPLPELYLVRGTIEILKGNIEAGQTQLENILKLTECPKDIKVNALIKLGTLKVQGVGKEDSIQDAFKLFEEAINLDPNNPDIYLHRAQIYLLSEQVDESRKDLEKCCSLDADFPSAVAQKLYVQFRCGIRNNDEGLMKTSIKSFEEAVQKFPNSSEVFSLYAQTLMEQGQLKQADEFFAKATEIDPQDGNLLVHRSILYLHYNNDVDMALKYLDEARKVDPSCQFAYEMLGSIEVQRGNLLKGVKYFDKALELAQTELDCCHLYSLRDGAEAQYKASKLLGIELPG